MVVAPKKLNILVVTAWWPHAADPLDGNFVAEQVRLLAGIHSVRVIRLAYPRWRAKPRKLLAEQGVVANDHGAMVITERVMFPSGLIRLANYSCRRACLRGWKKVVRDGWIPDVIHAHNFLPSGLAAVFIGGKFKIPAVITEHSSWFVKLLDQSLTRQLIHQTAQAATFLLPVGSALGRVMQDMSPSSDVEVVGNIVDTSVFVPGSKSKPVAGKGLRWLSVACLVPGKGMAELLEGFAAHAGSFPDATLTIGGDGPELGRLKVQTVQLGLLDKVRFRGLLTQEEVVAECQKADAFILASHAETFGLAYAEAMACGLPVVATLCGGPQDFVTPQTGILIPPHEVVQITKALSEMTVAYHQYSSQVVRDSIIAKYSPGVFIRRLEGIYDKAINGQNDDSCI